jgi:hypothetical protein
MIWSTEVQYSNNDSPLVLVDDTKSHPYFDFLKIIFDRFILNYENIIQFPIEIEVKSWGYLLSSTPSIMKYKNIQIFKILSKTLT